MKPTKMRNKMIYQATFQTKNKQIASPLSKQLSERYRKKSARILKGDTVKILRGEFKGVDGKISQVSIKNNGVAVEGTKKEKTKGEKFDVYTHASNVLITSLNTSDRWRITKLEKKASAKTEAKDVQKDTEQSVAEESGKRVAEESGKRVAEESDKRVAEDVKEIAENSDDDDDVLEISDDDILADDDDDDDLVSDSTPETKNDDAEEPKETSIFQPKEDKA